MKTKSYIFYIRSNHGTDVQHLVRLNGNLKKKEILSHVENWCSGFGAWVHSDNTVEYGWAENNQSNLKKLSKYNEMKNEKSKQIHLLAHKNITNKDFETWLKKNKKKMMFPFKT